MFPILKLPAELRAIVFASAPEQQDLAHLTLSCRVVHEETQHLLYRSPKLEGLPAFFSFERTLADSPHLARSIVRLCYVLEGFKPNSGSSGCPAGPCNTMGRSPRIMRIIDGLSCLNEVEFLTRGPTYDAGIFVTRFAPARYRLHTLWAMLFWTAVGRHELLGVDNVSSAPPIHISKCRSLPSADPRSD